MMCQYGLADDSSLEFAHTRGPSVSAEDTAGMGVWSSGPRTWTGGTLFRPACERVEDWSPRCVWQGLMLAHLEQDGRIRRGPDGPWDPRPASPTLARSLRRRMSGDRSSVIVRSFAPAMLLACTFRCGNVSSIHTVIVLFGRSHIVFDWSGFRLSEAGNREDGHAGAGCDAGARG